MKREYIFIDSNGDPFPFTTKWLFSGPEPMSVPNLPLCLWRDYKTGLAISILCGKDNNGRR
jgi:hypothetical protein